jgi:hypothetical protein
VVFSFSALSGRCFVSDPAFSPAFAWADGHFRERQASPQVAVLLVGAGNVPQPSVEGLITNLVAGSASLEALKQAGRVHWWNSELPALADTAEAVVGELALDQPQELSEQMLHALTSLLQRPAVARLPGGSPGTRSVRSETRNRFATGFLVCCFAILLLLLAPLLFPSLEGTFVGWFLPTHSSHLADLQARASGLSNNASRLATEKELLVERSNVLERQNSVLADQVRALETALDNFRKRMEDTQEQLDKAMKNNDILLDYVSKGLSTSAQRHVADTAVMGIFGPA